jgi:DNA-damage-inducible protein D
LDFAKFQNEGFMGMYNMMSFKLAEKRGVKGAELYDHMGRTELAANLFRITLTEEKIALDQAPNQRKAGIAHREVGKEVRNLVKKNTGMFPEELPQERKLPQVKGDLKAIGKKLGTLDGAPKKLPPKP